MTVVGPRRRRRKRRQSVGAVGQEEGRRRRRHRRTSPQLPTDGSRPERADLRPLIRRQLVAEMTMIAAAADDDDDDASTDLAFATPKEARDGHRRPDEDQGADDRCDEAAGGEAGEVALGIAAVAFKLDIGGGGGGGGGGPRVTFFTRLRRPNTCQPNVRVRALLSPNLQSWSTRPRDCDDRRMQ